MEYHKTLILIFMGLSSISCSHIPFRKYYYISSAKTWKDAQLYCRENHVDLATFESIEEVNQLSRPAGISGSAWIGLHDDPASWRGPLTNDSNSWRWSTTGQVTGGHFYTWFNGLPDYWLGKEVCGIFEPNAQWNDALCEDAYASICYTDMGQNQKTYAFVSTLLSWSDAQANCRQHYTDLAMITSAAENSMALSVASGRNWMGLYRIPWAWSDMSPLGFTNWDTGSPDNVNENQHCASENEAHRWIDSYCTQLKPFICYGVRTAQSIMKLKMKTTADLSDPVVQQQILQKLGAAFASQGWADVKLKWTTPPQEHPH